MESKRKVERSERISAFVVSFSVVALIAVLSIIPFCGIIFSCGCNLADGVSQCNIFKTMDMTEHCPWCSHGMAGFLIPFALALGASGVTTIVALMVGEPSVILGWLIGIVSFWFWGSVIGLVTAIIYSYPWFYGFRLF